MSYESKNKSILFLLLLHVVKFKLYVIIIIIIIKKDLSMQGREREIDTLSVRRPQPHTTNL